MKLPKQVNDTLDSVKLAAMRTQNAAVNTVTTTQMATAALVAVCAVSVIALIVGVVALKRIG